MGKLDLKLVAAKPDRTGGLAPVVGAHLSFILASFAFNAVLSGAIANDLLVRGLVKAKVRGKEIA